MSLEKKGYPTTPDGRYFVVRGRLWRKSNPNLAPDIRQELVRELMQARLALRGTGAATDREIERSIGRADGSANKRQAARAAVDRAKVQLGERGPVWWNDGAPDFNRKMAVNTPYAAWFEQLNKTCVLLPSKCSNGGVAVTDK